MSSRFAALSLATALSLASAEARAQCPPDPVAVSINDSAGFIWDVTPTGGIVNGSIDAYDYAFMLRVNGTAFSSASAAASELAGRQVLTAAVTLAGVTVQRRVWVPTTQPWARFYDTFTNPTAAPLSITVRLENNAGSDGGTVITGSSSGDTSFSIADRWVSSDDADGSGDPSTAYVLWGEGGRERLRASATSVFDCAGPQGYLADFVLIVPPGGTVALLYFGIQANNRAASINLARSFDTLPDVALTGLSPSQRAAIVNWAVCGDADLDGDGQTCAAGDCNDADPAVFSGAPERCNQRDDNCNNMADEGLDLGGRCTAGVGACTRSGTRSCSNDGAVFCSATPGMPTTELCGDSVDNDCDGSTDEGFDVGASCTVGVGACASNGTRACSPDRTGTVCSARPGTGGPERCDGLDNDCDGSADEDFDVGQPCAAGTGACRAMGQRACAADGTTTTCGATAGAPTAERCDGLDNDCNGMVDEGSMLCAADPGGARCLAAGTLAGCGCTDDRDCGGAMGGRTCDPQLRRCVPGCVEAPGRNACPAGMFCTSQDPARIGFCAMDCTVDAHCATMAPRARCLAADAGLGRCVECVNDGQCSDRGDGRARCLDNACAQCSPAQREVCTAAGPGSACLPSGLCGCVTEGDCAAGRRCEMGRCVQGATDGGVTDGGLSTDLGREASTGSPGDAGVFENFGSSASGCGCRTAGRTPPSGAWLALLALAARRRRRGALRGPGANAGRSSA